MRGAVTSFAIVATAAVIHAVPTFKTLGADFIVCYEIIFLLDRHIGE